MHNIIHGHYDHHKSEKEKLEQKIRLQSPWR